MRALERPEPPAPEPAPGPAPGRSTWPVPLGVGIVVLVVAWRTLLPGVGLWDTAEFQVVGPLLGTAHPTGYPSYVILGWLAAAVLAPLGELAFRMNLLAALLGGATAGLSAVLARQLTGRASIALASGLVAGLLPVAWRLATHADPHGFQGALVVLLLVLLVAWDRRREERWLLAAAVVYGVALGNHALALLLAPGLALFVVATGPAARERAIPGRERHERERSARRWRLLPRAGLVVAVTTALLYLELPLRAGPLRAPLVYGSPQTPGGFLYVVSGAQFVGAGSSADALARAGSIVGAAGQQLGPLAAIVPIALLVTAVRRPRYALLTVPAVLLSCWFAASYRNAEIDRYYLGPALIAVTWLAILADAAAEGLSALTRRLRAGAPRPRRGPGPAGLLAVELVAAVAVVAPALALVGPTLAALPSRWTTVDRSQDRTAAHWLDETLAALRPGAVVVSWWDYSTPLWYAQLCQGRRPDVSVIDDRTRLDLHLGGVNDVIDANLGRRPVYVIRLPADLAALATRYRLDVLPASATGQAVARVVARLDGARLDGARRGWSAT